LANACKTRFEEIGDLGSLAEAIDLHREALYLRPPGNPDRSISMNDLAIALLTRFGHFGDSASLAESIDLHRQALELRPYPHPDRPSSLANLGDALEARFLHQSLFRDLHDALDIAREGLRSCAHGHPMRVRFLFSMAQHLLRTGTDVFDFEGGVRHISEGLQDKCSTPGERLRYPTRVLPMVEAAIQFLADHTSAVRFSQPDRDELALQVYISALQLLPRAASFGLDYMARLRALSGAETISRDAAARAVLAGRTTEAVELLEEGRGVFWSQALRLRATDLDLLPDEDAHKLRSVFMTLEAGGMHDDSLSTTQRERHVEERRRLSEVAETLITDIRARPGLSRFLLPPAFSVLLQSLPKTGFVVILVASKLGYHALVLNGGAARAESITLPPPEGGFFSDAVYDSLPRDGGSEVCSSVKKDVSRLIGISKKNATKPRNLLDATLVQIWMSTVKPVIDILSLKVC
jgi:tetratricopeptide (TPR) repeat protein